MSVVPDEPTPPPALAQARAAFEEPPALDLDAAFVGVAEAVEAPPTPWTRLGALRLKVRTLASAALVTLSVASVAVLGFREGAFGPGLAHTALELVPLVVLGFLVLRAAMRPWHEPPLGAVESTLLVVSSLGATALVALFPEASQAPLAPLPSARDVGGAPCFAIGTAVGLAAYVATRILHRGPSTQALFAATLAGLAANAALGLHCGIGDVAHRLASHASVAFAFVLAMAISTALAHTLRR